mmetsp:Transcript_12995/g.25449  ORF Transcript_12995/g.25449 Transcript_12995/m.25449 type:complete len:210 (-) Transcript_12995:437-1066(-)
MVQNHSHISASAAQIQRQSWTPQLLQWTLLLLLLLHFPASRQSLSLCLVVCEALEGVGVGGGEGLQPPLPLRQDHSTRFPFQCNSGSRQVEGKRKRATRKGPVPSSSQRGVGLRHDLGLPRPRCYSLRVPPIARRWTRSYLIGKTRRRKQKPRRQMQRELRERRGALLPFAPTPGERQAFVVVGFLRCLPLPVGMTVWVCALRLGKEMM